MLNFTALFEWHALKLHKDLRVLSSGFYVSIFLFCSKLWVYLTEPTTLLPPLEHATESWLDLSRVKRKLGAQTQQGMVAYTYGLRVTHTCVVAPKPFKSPRQHHLASPTPCPGGLHPASCPTTLLYIFIRFTDQPFWLWSQFLMHASSKTAGFVICSKPLSISHLVPFQLTKDTTCTSSFPPNLPIASWMSCLTLSYMSVFPNVFSIPSFQNTKFPLCIFPEAINTFMMSQTSGPGNCAVKRCM